MKDIKILVVDDEAPMRKLIETYLCQHDYIVISASNGLEAIFIAMMDDIDLIVLDVRMPGINGWEVCKRIRGFSDVSILMLTACGETIDKVKGLKLGADDYLTKPFDEMELIARVDALIRRAEKVAKIKNLIQHKGITLDLDAKTVTYQEKEIDLTAKEFKLLHIFIANLGCNYSREHLLKQIHDPDYSGDLNALDTDVKKLREKLQENGIEADKVIQIVWQIGYKGV
jgi:two-component system, OmpR family, response regulator ResD